VSTARPSSAVWALTALVVPAVLLILHAQAYDFVNDDAYISFRYADNLVRHGELVYNPGERVEGYTNFLWTMTMAAVLGLGGDPVVWSRVLGIGFGIGGMLVVARFLARWRGETRGVDALGPMWLAAAPAYACWSSGGLETQQFTFFATLGWTSYLLEHRATGASADASRFGWARRFPTSGLWFALSALARPEGMLFFGLVGLHRLATLIRGRQWPGRRDWLWGAGFCVVFVPYYAWRWTYYGWPFPNTYYVKVGSASPWGPGLAYFWTWIRDHHLYLWPLLALAARRVRGVFWLFGLLLAGVSLHVIRVGGDFMALHRFLVPLMPVLAVVLVIGVEALWSSARVRALPRAVPLIAGLVLSAGLGARSIQVNRWAMTTGSEGGVDRIGWLKMFEGQCRAIGLWLRDNAPADASLATTAAGIIPYYSRLYTLDILGLNDEYIAHEVPARGNRPGHTKVAPEKYILDKHIDYLVYHPTITARPTGQGPGGMAAKGYVWRSVRVPDLEPPYWSFWERKR
jgi:arabinofuranosyltransferase